MRRNNNCGYLSFADTFRRITVRRGESQPHFRGWNGQTWGANQRISVEEALRINTINGAYNSHEEGIKGSITSGKLADFVVLADDPHRVDKDKIRDIEIVRTVVGGSTVYTA